MFQSVTKLQTCVAPNKDNQQCSSSNYQWHCGLRTTDTEWRPLDSSRHRGNGINWWSHLHQHFVQPLKRSIQVNLYPTWGASHILTMILCSPALHKWHPNRNNSLRLETATQLYTAVLDPQLHYVQAVITIRCTGYGCMQCQWANRGNPWVTYIPIYVNKTLHVLFHKPLSFICLQWFLFPAALFSVPIKTKSHTLLLSFTTSSSLNFKEGIIQKITH